MVCCIFFFQAEDGIRDLVRSRGLGDVYKRQVLQRSLKAQSEPVEHRPPDCTHRSASVSQNSLMAVSYTHLTLPTSDLV